MNTESSWCHALACKITWSQSDREYLVMDWLKIGRKQDEPVSELKEEIERLWLEVPKEMCMRLIKSIPKRIKACYSAKWWHFKYQKHAPSINLITFLFYLFFGILSFHDIFLYFLFLIILFFIPIYSLVISE